MELKPAGSANAHPIAWRMLAMKAPISTLNNAVASV
jgi:hypothetical protein